MLSRIKGLLCLEGHRCRCLPRRTLLTERVSQDIMTDTRTAEGLWLGHTYTPRLDEGFQVHPELIRLLAAEHRKDLQRAAEQNRLHAGSKDSRARGRSWLALLRRARTIVNLTGSQRSTGRVSATDVEVLDRLETAP